MHLHRDRRATPPCSQIGPPLRGRPEKPAERRRLLARSFGYATALHSSSAGFSGRSRPLPVMGPDPRVRTLASAEALNR